jgi:hypothetical protein
MANASTTVSAETVAMIRGLLATTRSEPDVATTRIATLESELSQARDTLKGKQA